MKPEQPPAPGVVFVEIPGVDATPVRHLLRAVFCYREVVPAVLRGQRGIPLPETATLPIDQQTVLAIRAGDPIPPKLLRDPRTFVMTAIAGPSLAIGRIFRHALATRPELAAEKPEYFGSLAKFSASRRDEITRALARSLGARRCEPGDFDFVAIEEQLEADLPLLVEALEKHTLQTEPDSAAGKRLLDLLGSLRRQSDMLVEIFGGPRAVDPTAPAPNEDLPEFRQHQAADLIFYSAAAGDRDRTRSRRIRSNWFRRRRKFDAASPHSGEPAFVFNHLPKCFGSSMRILFARGFAVVEDHTEWPGLPSQSTPSPVDTRFLAADSLLCGHLCHGAYQLRTRYPQIWAGKERFHLFTFLRDPLATALSNYHHVRRNHPGVAAAQPDLYGTPQQYLLALENPIAERLGCDKSNIDEVWNRYFFIGAAEMHQRDLPRLITAMRNILLAAPPTPTTGRAMAILEALRGSDLPKANTAPRRPGAAPDDEAVAHFRETNQLDYLLYARSLDSDCPPDAT